MTADSWRDIPSRMEWRWGLDLDMNAVRLLCWDGSAWLEQWQEKIDSPDIEDRLTRMIARIEPGAGVMLFLPREQVLFTEFTLDDATDPRDQIEAALAGRTPYSIEELSFDWEPAGGANVQIAAVARDTLDEAAAFAEVRNLSVTGYGTLFSGSDFPRIPTFDGPLIVAPEPAVSPSEAAEGEAVANIEAETEGESAEEPVFESRRSDPVVLTTPVADPEVADDPELNALDAPEPEPEPEPKQHLHTAI